MSRTTQIISLGAVIAILLGALVALGAFKQKPGDAGLHATSTQSFPAPTDTVKTGTIVFDTPGLKQDTPYLVYEEPGKPALTAELLIDEYSNCVVGHGGLPCLAMNVQYRVPFGGKRAIVEGIRQGDKILVRTMRVAAGEEPLLPRDPGVVYVPWPQAVSLIQSCEASMVMQTHAGDVTLTLKSGASVTAITPVMDEVFSIAQDASKTCGSIPLATE